MTKYFNQIVVKNKEDYDKIMNLISDGKKDYVSFIPLLDMPKCVKICNNFDYETLYNAMANRILEDIDKEGAGLEKDEILAYVNSRFEAEKAKRINPYIEELINASCNYAEIDRQINTIRMDYLYLGGLAFDALINESALSMNKWIDARYDGSAYVIYSIAQDDIQYIYWVSNDIPSEEMTYLLWEKTDVEFYYRYCAENMEMAGEAWYHKKKKEHDYMLYYYKAENPEMIEKITNAIIEKRTNDCLKAENEDNKELREKQTDLENQFFDGKIFEALKEYFGYLETEEVGI